MDKIVVIKDCESYTPVLGNVKFSAGTEVFSSDPNYFPLLWSGFATTEAKSEHTQSSNIAARLKADRDRAKESE